AEKPALAPTPAEKPAAAPAAPVARGTRCTARVGTEPAQAEVFWGNKHLGRTPIEDVRVPCGASMVTVRHERYRPVSREVTAEPGPPAVLSERLHRPPGTLVVTSSPPHAHVVVNHDDLGTAPSRLNTMRFERVRIEATLPGYLPFSKYVYLREATT